ncbi:TlpA family protein disulfide reductase [Hyphomicrobium sp.]|jgi:thiol-disulfide isomerase/thioredoxin|uniref:TlpA family protein disulfide reductase n=1 Tax=Hyphomicrobium sp. TaxID=82 RepID=UPI00356640B6
MRIASVVVALTALAFMPVGGWASDKTQTRPFDPAIVQQAIDAHKGRPVIVHFWGLTCGNCMAELKDWGAFVQAHPEATLILVNWDERGARPAQIGPALATAGLSAASSFALGDGFEDKLRFAIDRDWMGELPYTRLIAADGSATTFSGAADFADLKTWLAKETR